MDLVPAHRVSFSRPVAKNSPNALYYGDNLDVLRRHGLDESVDLVYLDPPFNSNATYNVLFAERDGTRAAAQIKAFEDTWRWDEAAARVRNPDEVECRFRRKWNTESGGSGISIPGSGTRNPGSGTSNPEEVEHRFLGS